MNYLVPVFQLEVRYNHVLNFSIKIRDLLAPFVKLANSISIDKQNTIEEKLTLNFEDDNYRINVSWDSLIFKGQGDINSFSGNNLPIDEPFLNILNKIRDMNSFGNVLNILFAITYIKKRNEKHRDALIEKLRNKYFSNDIGTIMNDFNDMAITLENKSDTKEIHSTLGPYLGKNDLMKRRLNPVNVDALGDLDFLGEMLEYKYFEVCSDITLKKVQKIIKTANDSATKIWRS